MNISKMKDFLDLVESRRDELKDIIYKVSDIIILGNGGSNAVASHIAEDYTKVLHKRALSFSDSARLTCYTNDYGQDYAFVEFIKDFASSSTVVILISSSGNSANIVNCAKFCDDNMIPFITLTGFDKNNKLNSFKSMLNFHVDSKDYGEVECIHEIFLHSII